MHSERMNGSAPTTSRIAVSSQSLRAANPHQLIERLEKLRLRAVQLHLNQILDSDAKWGDAFDQLRDHEIWTVSGSMDLAPLPNLRMGDGERHGSVLDDQTWFASRFIAEQSARLADRACVGLVCTHIGPIPSDPASPEWAKLADRLGALAEIFANYGIGLAIETGQAPVEVLDSLLDQLNLPNLGVNFDPAAIVLAGLGDPVDALRRLAQRVRQADVRDATRGKPNGGTGREVTVGRGMVDWNAFFDIATGILPPIHFVIQREPRLAQDADLTAARDLIAYHLRPKSGVRIES